MANLDDDDGFEADDFVPDKPKPAAPQKRPAIKGIASGPQHAVDPKYLTPEGNTVTDQEVSDFLAGKRDTLSAPLEPSRAKAVEAQFVASKPYQERQARAGRAQLNQEQVGQTLAAMDLPSMGLGPRIAGALGMDRKKHERAMEQAVEENPGAHLAGALIGPGGAESLAGRMAIGGFQGGITAAAKSKADEPTISDAGGGAAIGTIGTLIAEGLLRGSGKLIGPVLQKVARSQALRALNPLKRDVTMLANQGIESKVADDLLESGVMKPFSNSANIAERVAPELEKRGAAVGASRSAIDDAARGDVVRPSDLAAKFEDLADDYADKPTPEMQSIARDLNSRAELIRSKPHLSLTEAEQSIKQPMDVYAERMARTTGSPPDKLEALAQARRLIKEGNEEAAHAVDPALAEKFIGAKGDYGRMAAVANILERNNPRALANRGLSPSDYGFGIATGQGYQPPASLPGEESGEKAIGGLYGMLAAKLHQQVRERGNSTLAHAANVGAKLARHAGAATVPASRASVGGLAPYIELLEEEKK